jgi:hypothetical protein
LNEVARMAKLGKVDPPVSVEKDDSMNPVSYSLSQNYPNPFNPTTTINFSLAKPGFTTLKVYNLTGRYVETLVSKEMPDGQHIINFNAANYSSGVYFYQLDSGDYHVVKKMMLMK